MRRLLNTQQWIKNKNMKREERKKRGGEKAKRKSQDCCDTFKPTSKFCFLCLLAELRKLIHWFVGALLMDTLVRTDLFTATFTKHPSHVRGSKKVLDSGFHVMHSGFQVLNSSIFSVKSLSFIPDSKSQDSRFQKHKFPAFRNLDSLTWGWKPVFLNSQTNYVFLHSRKRPALVTDTVFASRRCPLTRASVVVQFHPWFKFYFPLFQTHYHILPYPRTKENNI